jgi:hypothetical protein
MQPYASSSAPQKMKTEQRPTSRRVDAPPGGSSDSPPSKSLPPQLHKIHHGASNPPQRDARETQQDGLIKPVANSKHTHQSRGDSHQSSRQSLQSNVPYGSGKDRSLLNSQNDHTFRPVKSTSTSHSSQRKSLFKQQNGEDGSARDRTVAGSSIAQQPPPSQQIASVMDFDPPNNKATDIDNYRRMSLQIEELDEAKPNPKNVKKYPKSYGEMGTSLSCEYLDSLSAKDLMNLVLSESAAHFNASSQNYRDLQRALEQVQHLSLGSNVENFTGNDAENPKFLALREVVKSYMSGEINARSNVDSDYRESDQPLKVDTGHNQEHHTYNFGDEGRRRDMVKDDNADVAIARISSLEPGDPAFIRRTTGKWTYAKVKDADPELITFIVDVKGSLKSYKVKYWASHVRASKSLSDNHNLSGRSGIGPNRFSVEQILSSTHINEA